ncbi:hypothetical protein NESM_000850500 [Novymonas esmeraldas]|uniref:Uncharacterized protein n=1 Tax=Novymonas esmeraldas TaxID=1808958 RepID=A0AAW0F0I9_9TRYP
MSSASPAPPPPPCRPHDKKDDTAASVVFAGSGAAPRVSSINDFFSFSPTGGFTWWAGAILGLLACLAFASMVTIGVRSSQRQPPAVLSLMGSQQCSLLSPVQPPVAYEAWMATCAAAHRGYAYPCVSQVDCVVLGPHCAPAGVLAEMQCVDTGARADRHPVCAYPAPPPITDPPRFPGFCTTAGTSCAVCTAATCEATSPSYGSVGCPPTSACSGGSWLCNPI